MEKRVIIYSHGFGVRRDDRGLFTAIAASLPDAKHVMFDYNQVDQVANTLTVPSLATQVEAFRQMVANVRADSPDAITDIIGHSQGCLVVAMARPEGIRKTIFTAPPPDADVEAKIRRWKVRYGTQFTTTGTSYLERKDGSITVVPPEYWAGLEGLDARELYNALGERTDLTIITATQDEVLDDVVFNGLSKNIQVIKISTGHNFEEEGRQKLIDTIRDIENHQL